MGLGDVKFIGDSRSPRNLDAVVGMGDAQSTVSTGAGLYGFIAVNAKDPGTSALKFAADAKQTIDARLLAAASPQAQAAIVANGYAGAEAAIKGQPLTEAQVQSGFALGASGALMVAGVSATAALAIMAPIAAVVFGGGELIGLAIQKAFGITNHGVIACSSDDPTKYGSDPTDPKWLKVVGIGSTIATPGGPTVVQPATDGSFERWARPVIRVALELSANCKPIPGAKTWRDFANGLISVWNAMAAPGSPMRTIGYVWEKCVADPSVTFGSAAQSQCYAQAYDPVQVMIQSAFMEQYDNLDRTNVVAPAIAHPWAIQVADPKGIATPFGNPSSTKSVTPATTVATAAVAAPAAIAVGTVVYAWATGRAVESVFGQLWSVTRRYWRYVTKAI